MTTQYDAFLSYSHDDEKLAALISKRLQGYKAPIRSRLRGQKLKLFRDVELLTASSNLSEELNNRIQAAKKLILICSPSSASSDYVKAEVHAFLRNKKLESVLFVLHSGELKEGLPPNLNKIVKEPLFIDLRNANRKQFRLESLRLIAALFEVDYDELRRKEEETRRRKRNGLILAMLMFLSSIASAYLITSTNPETWLKVPQPDLHQNLMPIHEYAVNDANASILLYKGHDANWGTNPRPEGFNLIPSERIADFENIALQQLKTHLNTEPIAVVKFELQSQSGTGQINIHGIFDRKKNVANYYRSLYFEGETKSGGQKILMIPPSLESISDEPFNLSPWPYEILKTEGFINDWWQNHGTITDLLRNKEINVEFYKDYLDEGYDEWVEIWNPEHIVFSNVSSEELTINGDTLSYFENEDDLWNELIKSQEWVTYQKPERKDLGGVYEGDEDDIQKIVQAISNENNHKAIIELLHPMFMNAEFSNITLISSTTQGVQADILEISGIIDSPEITDGLPLQWLFRGSDSSPWLPVNLPTAEQRTKIVDIIPVGRASTMTMIVTENHGYFLTDNGGETWTDANFGEANFRDGSKVKTIIAGSPSMIYSLVDRNKTFDEGENLLFRFKHRNWIERWQAGLIRVLQ